MQSTPIATAKSALQLCLACLAGAVSGFIAITLPAILSGHSWSPIALAEFSVKNLSGEHLLLLLAAGIIWGLLLNWPYSLLAAIFEVGSLPVIAVLEILRDSTSHNLWPLEFLMYAGLSLIPAGGMIVGLLLKKQFRAQSTHDH